MCLMGYDYMILDNAFLVHAPHLIRINRKETGIRYFYKQNKMMFSKIKDELVEKYPGKNACL